MLDRVVYHENPSIRTPEAKRGYLFLCRLLLFTKSDATMTKSYCSVINMVCEKIG